ncbi:MAG: putative transposase [Gammaproteobacteria bacterium]|jgi:putative transposase
MAKFQNKYRIESARKPEWDYRNPGQYFITICTHEREHFFWGCSNGKMTLSTAGAIVQGFWFEIPKHFAHVRLGEFVVMPNHVHGVLILSEMVGDVGTNRDAENDNDKRQSPGFYKNITPKSGSISTIIGSFKSICTKHIRKTFPDLNFKWQERFHDHIIRNESSYTRISNYIINNPSKWKEDKFFK